MELPGGAPAPARMEGFPLGDGLAREPHSESIQGPDHRVRPPNMFAEIFARFERVCLVGHTHIPGIFYEGPRFVPQREVPETFAYEEKKMVVNVGSVGQPRDHDPRACYVTSEGGAFHFHRLE